MINNIAYNFPVYSSPLSKKAPHTSVSFCGLEKRYKKNVYTSIEHMQALCNAYPKSNGIVGDLPKDMIKVLKTKYPNDLSDKIKETRSAFAMAASILHEADNKKGKINIDEITAKYFEYTLSGENKKKEALLDSVQKGKYYPKDYIENLTEKAEKALTESMQKTGIIEKTDKAELKYLNYGEFGEAYELDFIDKKGESKFGKFALKVFKDPEKLDKANDAFKQNLNDYFSSDQYFETIRKFMKKYPSDDITSIGFRANIDFMTDLSMPKIARQLFQSTNGVYAEANAAKFLQQAAGGNIDDTSLNRTFFFDLKRGYSLARLSDETLPKPKVNIDISKFGLVHNDKKEENIVCDRLIDYGSIVPITPKTTDSTKDLSAIVSNKSARSTYNKIRRIAARSPEEAKAKYLELKEKAEKNKLPQSKSVLVGLELSKEFFEQ